MMILLVLGLTASPLLTGAAFADAKAPSPPEPWRIVPQAPAPNVPGSPQTPAPTVPGGSGDINATEAGVAQVVDGFWKKHFTENFPGRQYTSPRVAGAYVGTSGPRCGGAPSAPNNAFYCPAGDFLAWDQNLMTTGYQKIGDSWIYLVISHEWGHAIQNRISRAQVSPAAELQADCLAGATLAGAQRDGTLKKDAGDDKEIADTLTAVADKTPWTNSSSHGNAQQRIAAYNKGTQGGVKACL